MYSKSKYAGLPEFVDYLHKNGLHYIPIIDPAISSSEKLGTYKPYEIGLEMDIFIQNFSGDPFEGRVWTSGKCVWPDFTNPKVILLFSSHRIQQPIPKLRIHKFLVSDIKPLNHKSCFPQFFPQVFLSFSS